MIYVNARAFIERYNNGEIEIVIQTRNKPGEDKGFELPGGQVNEYESLIEAVKREVLEETGLKVSFVHGEESIVTTKDITKDFVMECIKPLAVYQTIKGPVDSMGVYFICNAEGNLTATGDFTLNATWININELHSLVNNNKHLFCEIDLAGIMFYLKEKLL